MNRIFLATIVVLITTFLYPSSDLYALDKRQDMKNDTDWAMERHDPQMTGRTTLKGNMTKAPKIVWRHYLGLWNNHLTVTTSQKKDQTIEIPEDIFGESYVYDNALFWDLRQPQIDIDGKGTLVNQPQDPSAKYAKLLPNVKGYQRVEFDNAFGIGAEANFGRMYAYDEGKDKPRLVWQTERVRDMYSPVVAIADTDLDGQDEVVLLTHYHLAIYDALTGKIKDNVEWNVGRNYGQLDVIDVDHDRRPDFVVQADAPPHLEFIQNSPNGAKLVWSHKYLKDEADVAVPTDFILNMLPNSIRDLDGDGRIELAVNIRHFKDDRRWHVVIFDVLIGEVKSDLVDRYLWAVADLDSDGNYELFLSEATGKTVERNSLLSVVSYNGDFIPRWKSESPGSFCMKQCFYPNNAGSTGSRGPVHHSTIIVGDVDNDGFNEFFASVGQSLLAVGLKDSDLQTKWTITSPSDRPPKAIAMAGSRALVELNAESGVININGASAKLESHYQAKGYRTTPSVADIDGDGFNEIVVEDAGGFINVIDPPKDENSNSSIRWKFKAFAQSVWVTWKAVHAPVPLIDLDNDGKKEVICSDSGDEQYTTIYALRSDGSIFWKSELPDISSRLTETFRVGKFRKEGWDIIVTIMQTTQPEMLCLDGRTGKVRWHKKSWTDDNNRAWPYPNCYVCYDSDGDGFHEIHGSYAYIAYHLDGNTGEPIRKPFNIVTEIFNRWQSYFYPIPADFNGDGKDEFLLASTSFAMGGLTVITQDFKILWELPLPNTVGASGLQGVGDCDGDGIPEIAFYHLDGRIVCYDGKTGEVQWELKDLTHGGGGHFVSGDIDSDGRYEFLFSLGSNEIIALDNDVSDHILWKAPLPSMSDTPILADIDDDGFAEIIVCTSDGYLNVLK